MTPARATVLDGEALEHLVTLEDETVDAVICDPPYSSGGFSESARRQARGQGLRSAVIRAGGWFASDNMGTAGFVWMLRGVAVQAHRILRTGGSLVVFMDWRQWANLAPALESSGLRLSNMIVWAKPCGGLGAGFRAQHELCAHLTKGPGRYSSCTYGNVLEVGRIDPRSRNHQTEKPVDLMRPIVETCAPRGGLVVDPFCGSGSTGVACLELGRNFLGVELDPENARTARRRLEETAEHVITLPEVLTYDAPSLFPNTLEDDAGGLSRDAADGAPA